jgi:hypothetical protein
MKPQNLFEKAVMIFEILFQKHIWRQTYYFLTPLLLIAEIVIF